MIVAKIARCTARLFSSPYFFSWIVVVFLAQATFSAIIISSSTPGDGVGGRYEHRNEDGVVPDGHRHLGGIFYYAERSIFAGPIITELPEGNLWMGDFERFPSYLYHYLLSFPVRMAIGFNFTDTQIVWLVRFIGAGLGVIALIVFRRITELLTNSVIVQNLSTLSLAVTGSFVWLSAAENYDVPSLLLWLAFIYAAIALFTRNQARYLYWMVVWFVFLGVTKYTYVPFAGLAGVTALALYIHNLPENSLRTTGERIFRDFREWVKGTRKFFIVVGILALAVGAGLFCERIIGNLFTYHSFNPSCISVHTHEGCMNSGVYARNYNQLQSLKSGQAKAISYNPIEYGTLWVKRYYDSMYAYMGHIYIYRYSVLIELTALFTIVLGAFAFVVTKRKKIRVLQSQAEWFLISLAILLVVSQLVFNINIITTYGGQLYAHQGRYLLSAVGFVYILYFIAIKRVYTALGARHRQLLIAAGAIIAIYAILTTSAIPSFLIHAINPDWYSELARHVLPGWIINHPIIW